MNDDERYQAGLRVRREVLGDEYVDRAVAGADAFTQDLQEYLNKFCWGVAWTRPGLDRRTRSLVTLAILGATGKTAEVKTHTLGALRNGCTPEQIKEVFLHLATYVGVPSAVDAFRAAQPVVAEHSKTG
jgi:4-carboxymuconolactone decarboxylase